MYVYNYINTLIIDILIFMYIHCTMAFYIISIHDIYEYINYSENVQVPDIFSMLDVLNQANDLNKNSMNQIWMYVSGRRVFKMETAL